MLPGPNLPVSPIIQIIPLERFDVNKERDLSNQSAFAFTHGGLPANDLNAITASDNTLIPHVFEPDGFCWVCLRRCLGRSTDLQQPDFSAISPDRVDRSEYPDIPIENQLDDRQSTQPTFNDTSSSGNSAMAPHPDDGHRLFGNELGAVPQYDSYEAANIANGLPPFNGSAYGYQRPGQTTSNQFQQPSPMGNVYQTPASSMSSQSQQTTPVNSQYQQPGQMSNMYQQLFAQINGFDQRFDPYQRPLIPVAEQYNQDYQPTLLDYTYMPNIPQNQDDWNAIDLYGFPTAQLNPGVSPLIFDEPILPESQEQAQTPDNGGQDEGRGRGHTRTPTQTLVAQAWEPNAETSPYKAQYHHRQRNLLANNSRVASELGASEKHTRDRSRGRYVATEEGAGSYQVMRSNNDGTAQAVQQVNLGIQREGVPGPNGQEFGPGDHWKTVQEWDALQNNGEGFPESTSEDLSVPDHLKPLTAAEVDDINTGANAATAEFIRNGSRNHDQYGPGVVDSIRPLPYNQNASVVASSGQQQRSVATPFIANDPTLAASYDHITDITTTVDTSNNDEVVNVDSGDTTMQEPLQSEFTNMMDDLNDQSFTEMMGEGGDMDTDMSMYNDEEAWRIRNGQAARGIDEEALASLLMSEMNKMR